MSTPKSAVPSAPDSLVLSQAPDLDAGAVDTGVIPAAVIEQLANAMLANARPPLAAPHAPASSVPATPAAVAPALESSVPSVGTPLPVPSAFDHTAPLGFVDPDRLRQHGQGHPAAATPPAVPGYSGNAPTPDLSSVALPPSPALETPQDGTLSWLPAQLADAADTVKVSVTFGEVVSFVPRTPHASMHREPGALASAHGAANPGDSFSFLEHIAREPSGAAIPASVAPSAGSLDRELRPELVPSLSSSPGLFDPHAARRDFPILQTHVHGRPLIWLDNAATTQKPQAVIDRLSEFYEHENSNIHRGAHALAARATDAYEAAREKVRRFLNAGSVNEIIFVRGATEGINLIAQSWGRRNVKQGDEIVITWLEHHANIVPWQQLCAETGAKLRVAPVDDTGQIILEEYEKLLTPRTRLVSLTQVSNALGTITPAAEMVAMAHRHGACVVVDGAQSVSHMRADVRALDCDFFVFSGHKVFGPNGIGAVYGKQQILDATPPWQGGGNMIADVTFEKTVYQPAPARFEAGTGNIADAVGLGAAIDYVDGIGMETIARHEHDLLEQATHGLKSIRGLRLIGTAAEKAGVLSFVLDGCRTEDIGKALDREGIAVRSGHHCAQPILRRFGLESTVRPSLALYNTAEDIEALVRAVHRIQSNRGL